MAARVEERPELAARLAHHDDAVAGDLLDQVVAHGWDSLLAADCQPSTPEDLGGLEAEHVGFGILVTGERRLQDVSALPSFLDEAHLAPRCLERTKDLDIAEPPNRSARESIRRGGQSSSR